MTRLAAKLERGDYLGAYRQYQRLIDRRLEFAALDATDRAARMALRSIQSAMSGAGLSRLGKGLSSASDLSSGRGVHRREGNSFSASGTVFIRSRSERSRGAIEAYTQGANIRPVRGRWLWIPTDAIPSRAGRYRMTPELFRSQGLEQKIGKLILLKNVDGRPLFAVENVGISLAGKPRSAGSLTKRGEPRKGQVKRQLVIAFIGIPRTNRAARVDVPAIMQQAQAALPALLTDAIKRSAE